MVNPSLIGRDMDLIAAINRRESARESAMVTAHNAGRLFARKVSLYYGDASARALTAYPNDAELRDVFTAGHRGERKRLSHI